ncbi:MAG: sigma-70 family RNA polymerase sigma factor [Saprospiraceae bacterium]
MPAAKDAEFYILIARCSKRNRQAQNELYKLYFSYGMSICTRYVNDRSAAITILNDAFLRIFNNLNTYNTELDFKPWFKTIVVRSAINYLKKMKKYKLEMNIDNAKTISTNEDFLSKFNYIELLEMIQSLTLAYRTVFNMYVIDGYKHNEIANTLGITVSTSKSNLTRAKQKLRELISKRNKD